MFLKSKTEFAGFTSFTNERINMSILKIAIRIVSRAPGELYVEAGGLLWNFVLLCRVHLFSTFLYII